MHPYNCQYKNRFLVILKHVCVVLYFLFFLSRHYFAIKTLTQKNIRIYLTVIYRSISATAVNLIDCSVSLYQKIHKFCLLNIKFRTGKQLTVLKDNVRRTHVKFMLHVYVNIDDCLAQ